MRAACLLVDHRNLTVHDIEIDQPGPHEVLIRTSAVGLCHSDLHVLDGSLVRPRPMVLGHEAAGVIEAIGSNVRGLTVGQSVVTCLVMGCGSCGPCERGEPHLCADPSATRRPPGAVARLSARGEAIGQMANVGALGEQILVDERAVIGVPSNMPPRLAALLGCAVVTGLGSVFNVARVQPCETVAVIGCGGIGLAIVQGARIAGASRIIAVDVSAEKLELARKLGATDVVDASTIDPVSAVVQLTGGVDHAFEAVGRPATVEQAIAMVAKGRTAYVVGMLPDQASITMSSADLRACKSVVGVFMGSARPRFDIPRYVELWQRGLLDLESMVSDVLTLDQVNEGFEALARGGVTRAVIDFTHTNSATDAATDRPAGTAC
jgi:S-(hydroxymethyl)glutathione dehydrogenase / alcohol dehydrogenase